MGVAVIIGIIILVLVFIFSEDVQDLVFSIFGLAGRRLGPVVPVAVAAGSSAIKTVLIAIVGIALAIWGIGALAQSAWEGFFLAILFLVWLVLFILSTIPGVKNVVRVPSFLSKAILALSLILFVSFFIPPVKASLNHFLGSLSQKGSSELEGFSSKLESPLGREAITKQDVTVYSDNGKPYPGNGVGRAVRVLIVKFAGEGEPIGMALVRFPENNRLEITEHSPRGWILKDRLSY
jgi:hypothetical protein